MNEEQAVLDFFAKPQNLPLGIAVAEQIDAIRAQLNSAFWQNLTHRLNLKFALEAPEWQTDVIEDRNAAEVLVGLNCKLREPQTVCLLPMIEQQYMGGTWRIFFGLMWQTPPTPEQLALPEVVALKNTYLDCGFKNNDSFLAWQWTNFYPRRRDFLLRYSQQPDVLLCEVESIFSTISLDQRTLISNANNALRSMPHCIPVSLDQLRRKRID